MPENTTAVDEDVKLREDAGQKSTAFRDLYAAVNDVEDADLRDTLLSKVDAVRIQQVDNVKVEHWVFPGVPLGKFGGRTTGGIALDEAEQCAADWAEKHESQATVINVELTRNPDGSWWAPTQYAQYQGVRIVTEEQLRPNEAWD